MNQGNLVKRIKQLGTQIEIIEASSLDETLREEWIENKKALRKYYVKRLRELKLIYWGIDEDKLLGIN